MVEHEQPVTIIGNVGKDAEAGFTPNGKPVTHFSVAVHAGEDKTGVKLVSWFRITAWSPLAEKAQSIKQGMRLRIAGQLSPTPRVYPDSNGETKASYDMTAFKITELTRQYSEKDV